MSKCRWCGREMTRRFGHFERHENECKARPQRPDPPNEQPPRFQRKRVFNNGLNVFQRS